MSGSKLVLTPRDPDYRPGTTETLCAALTEIGFIGDRFESDAPGQRYVLGERFLQLVTFMGCSPYIAMEPPEPGSLDFCHVILELVEGDAELRYGRNTSPPRCPHCRHRWGDWREHIAQWTLQPELALACPDCNKLTAPSQLDWRNSAGAGGLFVAVQNVFPGEAVPVDELMLKLADVSGVAWKYFYLQD